MFFTKGFAVLVFINLLLQISEARPSYNGHQEIGIHKNNITDIKIRNILNFYESGKSSSSFGLNLGSGRPEVNDPDSFHEHWLGDISRISDDAAETVCGDTDERANVAVAVAETGHYRWSCFLKIYAAKNGYGYWTGTGFILDVPGIPGSVMLTSAHCTWLGNYHGGYAAKIVVQCPGYDPFEVFSSDLHATPEYQASRDAEHDIGAIFLKEKFGTNKLNKTGFSWTNNIDSLTMETMDMDTCGYPGDKAPGTMWQIGGPIKHVTETRVYYMSDTYGGQSGSPVYIDKGDGLKTVVAVHGYGGCPNSAVRLTPEHIQPILQRAGYKGLQSGIRSFFVPNAFLRVNGPGHVVNAQFGCYKNGAETFNVIPIEVLRDKTKVILTPEAWPNMAVGMEIRKNGCKVVLADKTRKGSKIVFEVQSNSDGSHSFALAADDKRRTFFLELDSQNVSTWLEHGGGVAKCAKNVDDDAKFAILEKRSCNL